MLQGHAELPPGNQASRDRGLPWHPSFEEAALVAALGSGTVSSFALDTFAAQSLPSGHAAIVPAGSLHLSGPAALVRSSKQRRSLRPSAFGLCLRFAKGAFRGNGS
jgi:hypothetical protein